MSSLLAGSLRVLLCLTYFLWGSDRTWLYDVIVVGLLVPTASSLNACDDGLVDDRCRRMLFHSCLGDKGGNFIQPQDQVELGWVY